MKIQALAVAAAMALGMIGAAPAAAQPAHRTVVTHRTVSVHRTSVTNRNRHAVRHAQRRVCTTKWRHHKRVRTCTIRRW